MIYIVEDDENIRQLVEYTFNNMGMMAKGFGKASDFWENLEEMVPDIVLLDIMLPDEDGLSILSKIRNNSKYKKLPVIMMTAKGSEFDKVLGLNSGADDYIPKPFGILELVARVNALLRRTVISEDIKEYKIDSLYVNVDKHIVRVDNEEIILTLKEFELLNLLLDNRDKVLSRDTILETIWGYNFDGETRTVDVHIRMLRSKLGKVGNIIQTVRGVGYKIEQE
jgi:two-component system alkaline phosphatase synthesis response regulator PhoP